jgi:hypothetical protein
VVSGSYKHDSASISISKREGKMDDVV